MTFCVQVSGSGAKEWKQVVQWNCFLAGNRSFLDPEVDIPTAESTESLHFLPRLTYKLPLNTYLHLSLIELVLVVSFIYFGFLRHISRLYAV